jgi:hypothetical protein
LFERIFDATVRRGERSLVVSEWFCKLKDDNELQIAGELTVFAFIMVHYERVKE